jgi:hypothetical protein
MTIEQLDSLYLRVYKYGDCGLENDTVDEILSLIDSERDRLVMSQSSPDATQ